MCCSRRCGEHEVDKLEGMTHRRDELAEDEEVEEGMDTLSELYITGARARGDGLSGRPMWLQGRDRKQGTNAALGSGFGGHQAESMTILDREVGRQGAGGDAFQISGGGRRRGPAGLSPMQSTVHDDLPSPKPKMLSSAAALPHAAGLSGGGAGRGRRAQQAGGVVGGVTGSAIRSAQSNESMRESWDSLTLFARGHAGRLAPSMSAKHGAHGKVSNSDRKRFGGNGNAEAATAKVHEDHAFGGRAGGQGIRESSLNRLGSAPVDGRGDEESGSPPWAGDRQVISAHGIKDPSIRLDLHPFHIPVLPAGRHLRFDIITTWGDPHYVGLSGIELFDGNGAAISISESDISADPADIVRPVPSFICPARRPQPSTKNLVQAPRALLLLHSPFELLILHVCLYVLVFAEYTAGLRQRPADGGQAGGRGQSDV